METAELMAGRAVLWSEAVIVQAEPEGRFPCRGLQLRGGGHALRFVGIRWATMRV